MEIHGTGKLQPLEGRQNKRKEKRNEDFNRMKLWKRKCNCLGRRKE